MPIHRRMSVYDEVAALFHEFKFSEEMDYEAIAALLWNDSLKPLANNGPPKTGTSTWQMKSALTSNIITTSVRRGFHGLKLLTETQESDFFSDIVISTVVIPKRKIRLLTIANSDRPVKEKTAKRTAAEMC